MGHGAIGKRVVQVPPAGPCHGERSRSQSLFKLASTQKTGSFLLLTCWPSAFVCVWKIFAVLVVLLIKPIARLDLRIAIQPLPLKPTASRHFT